MLNHSVSLADQIEARLLDQIGASRPGERLPSEADMAGRFGVSRVTVREALASLERRGLITRRQGLGTFVNPHALQIHTRLDESIEFGALIRASGHTSSIAETHAATGRPEAPIAERLKLVEGDEVLSLHKVFSADGVPVIYVVNVIPLKLIAPEYRDCTVRASLVTEPLYTFLAQHCNQAVMYQVADIRAISASREVAGHLGCRAGSAMLNIEEVGYNAEDVPVFYSQEYYTNGAIQFKLLRKPGY